MIQITRLIILFLCCVAVDAAAIELIAHRGNGCGAVENSIDAVNAAWRIGAHAVELDVHVSSDKVAYVFHDKEIDGRLLSNLTHRKIRQLTDPSGAPKLADVLEQGTPAGYYILDLKYSGEKRIADVIAAVRDARFPPAKLAFQSQRASVLSQVNAELPDSQSFYLTKLRRKLPFFQAPNAMQILRQVSEARVDRVSFKGRSFVDASFVGTLRDHGYRVNVWTINDKERAAYYAGIGVDGIITDAINSLGASLGYEAIDESRCGVNEVDTI